MSITAILETITSIRPDQRKKLPGPPNAGFSREEYYGDDHVWVGHVTTQPGTASPWHHHGDHQTYAYVLEGEATLEFGEEGSEAIVARADGTLHIIPPHVAHREINNGSEPNRILIIRVGEGPVVVPLPGPPHSD